MRKIIYPKCESLHEGIGEDEQQGWGAQNTTAIKNTSQKNIRNQRKNYHLVLHFILIIMNAYEIMITRTLKYKDDGICKSFVAKLLKQQKKSNHYLEQNNVLQGI